MLHVAQFVFANNPVAAVFLCCIKPGIRAFNEGRKRFALGKLRGANGYGNRTHFLAIEPIYYFPSGNGFPDSVGYFHRLRYIFVR